MGIPNNDSVSCMSVNPLIREQDYLVTGCYFNIDLRSADQAQDERIIGSKQYL